MYNPDLMTLLGKFDHDRALRPKPIGDGEFKGNHTQISLIQVRLVNDDNLPRS